MINKTFNNFKFRRTYIGGSKKEEYNLFLKVQGIETDDCDWLEFRKLLIKYWDDILHVLISWEYFMKVLSIYLLLISTILFKFQEISLLMFCISAITFISFLIIRKKRIHNMSSYQFTLSIASNQIKEIFGVDFTT